MGPRQLVAVDRRDGALDTAGPKLGPRARGILVGRGQPRRVRPAGLVPTAHGPPERLATVATVSAIRRWKAAPKERSKLPGVGAHGPDGVLQSRHGRPMGSPCRR